MTEPLGQVLLNKFGEIVDTHSRIRNFFVALVEDDGYIFDEEWLIKRDRDYPHEAPHRAVFIYERD